MAIPRTVEIANGGSGVAVPTPTVVQVGMPVAVCQIVMVYIFMSTNGTGEVSPFCIIPSFTKMGGFGSGFRNYEVWYKVYNGFPVPATVPVEFRCPGATGFSYNYVAAAMQGVKPTTPIDVNVVDRFGGGPTEVPVPSVTATAAGVGGRLFTMVHQNVAGTMASKEGVQTADYNPASTDRSLWHDPGTIAAPGATGIRTITNTVGSEAFDTNIVFIAGEDAVEQKGRPLALVDTGYAYFNSQT